MGEDEEEDEMPELVPPEVKKILAGEVFRCLATLFLAFSMIALVSLPNAWIDEGLPKFVFKTLVISVATSGWIRVVAALSR